MRHRKETIIILTVSAKYNKYCVSGISKSNNKIVRIISEDEQSKYALSTNDLKYKDDSHIKPLDIIEIPVKNNIPVHINSHIQTENILIDNNNYSINKIGTTNINEVIKTYKHLFNQYEYVFGNIEYYIPESNIKHIIPKHSLELIQVSNVKIIKITKDDNTFKSKACFIYKNKCYNMFSITDNNYFNISEDINMKSAVLVVSLPYSPYSYSNKSEPKYYKLIAKIFDLTE